MQWSMLETFIQSSTIYAFSLLFEVRTAQSYKLSSKQTKTHIKLLKYKIKTPQVSSTLLLFQLDGIHSEVAKLTECNL